MHADSRSSPARARAGGTVLSLLATPLSVPILRAHLEGPLRLPDLREHIGGAAQTTLRGKVGNLRGIGALERHVRSAMPYTVENSLTPSGHGILAVADVVESWLDRAPQGPIPFGSEAAKGAIRSLVGGWGSTILRALAARPLSLTELDNVITDLSYPSLERRLSAMHAARQVEARPSEVGKAKPYAVTEWTRQAVAPLIAAGRCECEHFAETTEPMGRLDVEAAFLLASPLIAREVEGSGSCLLAVSADEKTDQQKPHSSLAGVHVEVRNGEVVSCASRLEQDPQAWALGTVASWVEAILDGRPDSLRLGGRTQDFARSLVEGIHVALTT